MKIKGNNQLLKIFSAKSLTQGLTLIELLIALFLSGIIFTAAAGGLMSVLSTNRQLEAKSNRKDELTRALNYMKREINEASYIQREVPGTSTDRLCNTSGVDGDCLKLIYLHPDSDVVGSTTGPNINSGDGDMDCIEKIIYYAFQDISGGSQTWSKPARLRRKEVRPRHNAATTLAPSISPPSPSSPYRPTSRAESCDGVNGGANNDEVTEIPVTLLTTTHWEKDSKNSAGVTPIWEVLVDGILGDNEPDPSIHPNRPPTCYEDLNGNSTLDPGEDLNANGTLDSWSGPYGQNASGKGGFLFCLGDTSSTNRGVQIFLYGYVLGKKQLPGTTDAEYLELGTVEVNSLTSGQNPLEHN